MGKDCGSRLNDSLNQEREIRIRPMRAEENGTIRGIMKRSFPIVQRWFFSFTPNVLVAELNGQLEGAIVLKLLPFPGGRRGGLLYWAFTSPDVRGFGIGQKLIEAGIRFLEDQGCDEILGCIEGNNTSSSKLLSTRGFQVLSPGQQLRRYGHRILLLWIRMFHYIDIGHFVWARPGPIKQDSAALQWFGNLTLNAVLLVVALWRVTGSGNFNLMTFIAVPIVLGVFFGGREVAMRITAKRLGFPVRYRAWESAFPLSVFLAFAFAWWFPIPGSVYPTIANWRYRDQISKLGPIALAGGLTVLTLSWGLWLLPQFVNLPQAITAWVWLAGLIGVVLVFFDVAMPFFPFVSFNGRRIWDWNRTVWFVLATATLLRLIV
jgi:GNAT superfamily N-acetyltransferase